MLIGLNLFAGAGARANKCVGLFRDESYIGAVEKE